MRRSILSVLLLSLIGCSVHHSAYDNNSTPPSTNETVDGGTITTDAQAKNPDGGTTTTNPDGGSTGCAPNCPLAARCTSNSDCQSDACSYQGVCITNRSCVVQFGGDTCGLGEVGEAGNQHESCCHSLPVSGYADQTHPGKTIYLDKYEITAGRMRAFVNAIGSKPGGIRQWMANNPPEVWNNSWNQFLPSDVNDSILRPRLLLGDPRHDGETNPGPGVIVPPATDQYASLGLDHQFGAQVFTDLHGNNCGVFPGAFGLPTYYYPAAVLTANNEVPRADGLDANGTSIPAQQALDVKAMNCATSEMFQALCHWDGGQLATSEVLDFITGSNNTDDSVSGCGTQYDNHGNLLGNVFTGTVQSGGRCPAVSMVNATFDAGDALPVAGSFLNTHNYHYPDLGTSTSDKSWEIAAPGRMASDNIGGWMDLAGNVSEMVLETSGGNFTGNFGIRYRGIGYGSSRSDLNVSLMPGETQLRITRPEVKSALQGARCQYYR